METKRMNDMKAVNNRTAPGGNPLKAFFENMGMRPRMTLLILIITIPLMLVSSLTLVTIAENRLVNLTHQNLKQSNSAITLKTDLWLRWNIDLLRQITSFDSIVSMQPDQQIPFLQRTTEAFPSIFLLHTLDLTGLDLARNDGDVNRDYSDREYYLSVVAGEENGSQVLISRTTNQPSLALSVPIRDASGTLVGILASAVNLTEISNELVIPDSDEEFKSVTTFIVDGENRVIAHPDETISSNLSDFGAYPPVEALRQGKSGIFEFQDAEGVSWIAYLNQLNNGWGVITQQQSDLALSDLANFRLMAWLVTGLVALLVVILAYFVVGQSLSSINALMKSAAAVAAGDFSQLVRINRGDEVGQLAQSFNTMTLRLNELVGTLEHRVAERTRALELSSEVGRRLTTILNPEQLVREVVEQLQQAFDYYHVHVYLFDERSENLILSGGTGETGRAMLAQGHWIARGKGLVGRSAELNRPVLVADTTQDPNWLPNPLLPETKAEAAVPISVGGRVLGVLDVQQNVIEGLNEADVKLIQSIAHQVAIALQNARAYSQAQHQAERDSLVAALNQKIQRATSVDEVLQTTLTELGQALKARRASVELRPNPGQEPGKN